MEIRESTADGVHVLSLSGRMDAATAPDFDAAAKALLDGGATRIVVDMEGLEYISSAGLRGVLVLVKSVKAKGGALAFCALRPMAAEVFRISGFNAILTICDTLAEAVARLRG